MADGDIIALEDSSGTEKFSVDSSGLIGTATIAAASVTVADAAGSIVAATAEAAIAELATPLTLTAGAEAANAIPITIAGPAHVAQYLAEVHAATMLRQVAANYTMAETGAGAEVSTTAQASLVFTTDAAGAAELTVTDVAGTSTDQLYLTVTPMSAQAGAKAGPAAIISITFA